ncbi:MAG: flagellar basal body-associated FliL family protein [Ideonella sp.]|nr:flagellar basal body-associated FliL family protein [Ideonella sp.]MCC7455356.1 flagellar basal body-associated FliL family protein [Nitrospira sp.]
MATKAAAAPPPEDLPTAVEVAPAQGKKKLILIAAAAALALLLALGGGAAYYIVKKKAAAAAAADAEQMAEPADAAAAEEPDEPRKDKKRDAASVFLPLEPFTVNLADRNAERFAQVGVTLELDGSKTSDRLKLYMPVIRNDVLMVLTQKKAADLQDRDGKLQLAREIKRAAIKALAGSDDSEDGADDAVRGVHFSSFIIQ